MLQTSSTFTVMSISAFLRGLLKDGKYRSTYDMADAFSTNEPNIVRWMSGKVRPSVTHCIQIAEATGRPVEEVVRMAQRARDTAA